jgi:hypothetical protein
MVHDPNAPLPGTVTALAIVLLAGGAWASFAALALILSFLVFSVGTLGLGLLTGPLWVVPIALWGAAASVALFQGIALLGRNASYGGLRAAAILLMVCVVACDVVSFACGVLSLILLLQRDTKAFFGVP